MNKIRKISISKPCEQKWDSMDDIGAGRFCSNCNKNVENFESKSNAEIIRILNSRKSKICGRFKVEQIQGINELLNLKTSSLIHQKLSSIAIGTMLLASACGTSKIVNHEHYNRANYVVDSIVMNQDSLSYSVVSGLIINEENHPLFAVNVFVENKGKKKDPVGTVTDEQGMFQLKIPNNNEFKNEVKVSYLGYESSYVDLEEVKNKQLKITMKDAEIILGEICIHKKK